jgi:hypothetical protein
MPDLLDAVLTQMLAGTRSLERNSDLYGQSFGDLITKLALGLINYLFDFAQ